LSVSFSASPFSVSAPRPPLSRSHDGRGQIWVAQGEGEDHHAAHAVPDNHRFLQADPYAQPCLIVGEELHSVALLWLVALAVAAQVHGHDAVASAREVFKLRRKVGVIAPYSVDQQDGRLITLRFLVEQSRPVSTQRPHATPLPSSSRFVLFPCRASEVAHTREGTARDQCQKRQRLADQLARELQRLIPISTAALSRRLLPRALH
jgi:hypothetical protein